MPYLRNSIAYDNDFWYTCVKWWYLQGLFSVFQNFDFLPPIKGQKMVQNDKKFCLLHSISEKAYIIWLSFMVNLCKMIISLSVFFHFFKILFYWVHWGVRPGQKTAHNDKIFCLPHSISQESYTIWLWFLIHMFKMICSISQEL